jgi:CRISPR-associated endoribonuclease Cas6
MRLGGLVGRLRLEGDLEPFAPILAAAETLHVGKGTTFGLGRVQVGENDTSTREGGEPGLLTAAEHP